MKFISVAQSFAAFAVISVNAHKSNFRKLSFLEAKPEDPRCNKGGAWEDDCTCRDGSRCYTTERCIDRGVGGSCDRRESDNTRSGDRMSCRNGESCINDNTACEDGSKCKERNGTFIVARNLDFENFLQAKPEDSRCNEGGAWEDECSCRDGSTCYTTERCTDREVNGSCARREPQDNRAGDRVSCRNGESCIRNNTACRDGSKCRTRNGARREPQDNRAGDRVSCRNGERCIRNDTECRDGSKCRNRNGALQFK